MRIVVLGYHDVGYVCLHYLLEGGEDVVAVVTHADRPHENVWWRSVAALAKSHQVPLHMPDDVNTPEFVEQVRAWQPDVIFSFYFRQMVSKPILDIPPRGCLNLHGSLLPKYAGRVPVNWVLVHGETETGVTLHYMVEKPDAGDIVGQRKVPIAFTDTARTLFDKVAVAAGGLFAELYPQIKAGTAARAPQDYSQRTYFGGRTAADGLIDWSWPAVRIYNLIRAVTHPYPGAFTTLSGRKLFIWEAWPTEEHLPLPPGTVADDFETELRVATGAGTLRLRLVQFQGEPEIPGRSLLARGTSGTRLGSDDCGHG